MPAPTHRRSALIDLNMPLMNGRDLLRVLKSAAMLQNIPVVVLTTSSAPTAAHSIDPWLV